MTATRELSRPDFPAVVHTYTDLLRVLAEAEDRTATPKHLAQTTERDGSNVRRDAQKLRDAGVIAIRADGAWTLTDKGVRWVQGQDVAAGLADAAGSSTTAPRWPSDKIRRNPINRVITVASVEGMADAIEGAEDILIPVRLTAPDANGVRMLLAGERRWEGVRLCERRGSLPEALKTGIPYTEGEVSADDGALIAVIENTARKDLSPWEDAKLLKAAADGLGITNASELARRIGRAREGDRGGLRDVQTKLRVAREATPEAIAAYEQNGSWDQLRDSVTTPKPSAPEIVTTRLQRLALAELWHKAGRTLTDVSMLPAGHTAEGARLAQYGLAILTRTDKGDLARVTQKGVDYLKAEKLDGGIEYARHALGFPEGYGVTKLRTEWLNTPGDNDPWLQGGWRLTTTTKMRTIVEGVTSAEARLYETGPYYDQRFRARLTIELEDGTTVESTRVPGPSQADLAYELAVEDVVAVRRDLPQAVVEWADKLSKRPFIVAGRNCLNATRAQEARYALGWDKRQSNSGGGSSNKPVEPDPASTEDEEETAELFPGTDAAATVSAAPVPPAAVMRDHLAAQAQAREHPTNAALRLIAEERRRQVESEGYSPDQDDEQNEDGEMALAAAAYAASAAGDPDCALFWPGGWDPHMFKPAGETRDLVRAGALIVAELERRARLSASVTEVL